MAGTATRFSSYDEAGRSHEWHVPERYNIAADVCDKHPRDKLAMIHEDFRRQRPRGRVGRAAGPRQPLRQRPARARRRARRPRRDAAAADARDGRRVLRHLEVRRDPALDVGALRRRRHPAPRHRLAGQGARDRRRQRRPRRPALVEHVLLLDDELLADAATHLRRASTPRPTIRPSSTTRRARPGWPRASSTRTATCSRTRSSSTATTCRTASSSTAWASGRGRRASRRCSARGGCGAVQFVYQREGGFDPHQQLDVPLAPRGRRTSSRRRPRCAR